MLGRKATKLNKNILFLICHDIFNKISYRINGDNMEENDEDIYALEIHPLIEQLTEICHQYDLPMFCTIQDGDTSFRTTCINEQNSNWYKIRLMCYLHQTWNIDGFLQLVIKDARENGHKSTFLKGMGIPEKPFKR